MPRTIDALLRENMEDTGTRLSRVSLAMIVVMAAFAVVAGRDALAVTVEIQHGAEQHSKNLHCRVSGGNCSA